MSDNQYNKDIYDTKTWQNIHVAQLSYTRNLLIILAVASLGFTVTQIGGSHTDPFKLFKFDLPLAGLSFLISIALGLLIALLESTNYRLKYKIARDILQGHDFEKLQSKCSKIEFFNGWALIGQVFLFLFGVIILCVTYYGHLTA